MLVSRRGRARITAHLQGRFTTPSLYRVALEDTKPRLSIFRSYQRQWVFVFLVRFSLFFILWANSIAAAVPLRSLHRIVACTRGSPASVSAKVCCRFRLFTWLLTSRMALSGSVRVSTDGASCRFKSVRLLRPFKCGFPGTHWKHTVLSLSLGRQPCYWSVSRCRP